MTIEQLKSIAPHTKGHMLEAYLPYLNEFMPEYEINTPLRQAAFIAQICHESGGFRHTKEIWGPTAAQIKYEGRKDLGNVVAGDGKRFMGRGLIQITGRANYEAVGLAITGNNDTFILTPGLLEYPEYATESACWFWDSRRLNAYADKSSMQDITYFKMITKKINGSYNGLDDRIKYYDLALKALGA